MAKSQPSYNRPPIVTIMGHVDHGKTTLLDAFRSSRITAGESGGITQHIGAYQAEHNGRLITFIDTPGHAAFSKMRARGATVTDVAVLVVAANDGVKPQTVESIQHLKAANVPLVVAINKVDVDGASADMVKAQLTEHEIYVEGYGGQVPAVPISALKREGLSELLETILLVADLEELATDPDGELNAIIIETKHDKHRGPVATAIVKNGTLKSGQEVYLGEEKIKLRALFDERHKSVASAEPGKPVEIMGFKAVPAVGSVITDKSVTPEVVKTEVEPKAKDEAATAAADPTPAPEESTEEEEEPLRFNVFIKADTQGTLEAIKNSLTEDVALVGEGIGVISESDILLAHSTQAEIIGFRVGITNPAKRLADIEKVKYQNFDVIYRALEYIEKKVLKMLEPTIDEEVQATAQVLALFTIQKQLVLGCKVTSGVFRRKDLIHWTRNDQIIKDVKIKSLKRNKEDVEEVKTGSECGLSLSQHVDVQVGDVLKSYRIID